MKSFITSLGILLIVIGLSKLVIALIAKNRGDCNG